MTATLITFMFGAMASFGFFQTKYTYPDVPRWWYAGDAAVAAFLLFGAIVVAS